jgi:hypothetical protein
MATMSGVKPPNASKTLSVFEKVRSKFIDTNHVFETRMAAQRTTFLPNIKARFETPKVIRRLTR